QAVDCIRDFHVTGVQTCALPILNTGSHKNRGGDEKNVIYAVNLEAAQEIARQIRLRNLGGLIIMDFIDMKERRHRNAVYEKMVRSEERRVGTGCVAGGL